MPLTRIGSKKKPSKATLLYILKTGSRIGAGAYREVFKTTRGKWVVKVNKRAKTTLGNNEHEYAAYLSIRSNLMHKLPANVKLPEMHMIGDYLIAEYVEGVHPQSWCSINTYNGYIPWHSDECPDTHNCWVNRLSGLKLKDMHRNNVILTKDDTLYIIDIGHCES